MARRLILAALAAAVLATALWLVRRAAPPAPDREKTFVSDAAGVIEEDSARRLAMLLEAVLKDTDVEVLVATLPSLDGRKLARVAEELFERRELGRLTKGNRGLLLLIAGREERVRLAVGYELEPYFPDAFVGYVERAQMAPYFADGHVGQGIEATVELIARQAYEQILGGALDPAAGREVPGSHRSGGGGAEQAVPIDSPAARAPAAQAGDRSRYGAQPTPALAWERFLEIQRRRIKDPELGLYDEAARAILRRRTNSDAGQDHLARLYEGRRFEVRSDGERAAIVFPDDPNLLLAPWFFRRAAAGWRMDGTMYPDVIGYNHLNQWRFKRRDHPYAFAFTDYVIDANGFARRSR